MRQLLLVACAASLVSAQAAKTDPWAPLRAFEGKWEGPSEGKPGKGSTVREYRFELDGKFFYQSDTSRYEPADATAKPLVHRDIGYFSFDSASQKLVWRQFHSEGFVNEYTLESASQDGKSLEFVTTRIENLPTGFRAKKIYRIVSADEIEETFLLAPPGKDLEVYTRTRLTRVK